MPGLFDGMRISRSGITAHRIMQEVVAHNIANASNPEYSRQSARGVTQGSIMDGGEFIGQGVEINAVVRIRDLLLDKQIRGSMGSSSQYEIESTWLQRIQGTFNEPSDHGINASLTNFWGAWSDLASPEPQGTRATVLSATRDLTTQINLVDEKLSGLADDIQTDLERTLTEVNSILEEIAQLNGDIFSTELGRSQQANDLRDKRDGALDRLSEKAAIRTFEEDNGMVSVFVAGHQAIRNDNFEKLELQNDTVNPANKMVTWEYGDRFLNNTRGELAGILAVRDVLLPAYQSGLDSFAATIIDEVNAIYSNGVGTDGLQTIDSRLGYESLGVDGATDALTLVPSGEYGAMHVAFYGSDGDIIRQAGILIESTDSLSDIATKLNNITGLSASVLGGGTVDGRLRIELDTISGDNTLGEASFAISNNVGGYDTDGLIEDLLGFSQTGKSTNDSSTLPLLESRDLTELQSVLKVSNLTEVRSTAIGLKGSFTINTFETTSESAGKTNGHHMEQFTINYDRDDTIDSIIAKINTLTGQYGISASINGTTNKIELTSTAQTDSEGNVVLAGGSDYLRLSFANDYRYPEVATDEPPSGYAEYADTTGLLGTMQMNTLLQGSDAGNISVDAAIVTPGQIHIGNRLFTGNSGTAAAIANLQHNKVTENGQFTIGEDFQNLIVALGSETRQANSLFENENLLLENFVNERETISGVNIDEELANMIQFQRAYDANARMLSTFNQMAQELLNVTGR